MFILYEIHDPKQSNMETKLHETFIKSIKLTVLTFFLIEDFFLQNMYQKPNIFKSCSILHKIVVKKVSNIENKYENVLEKVRK